MNGLIPMKLMLHQDKTKETTKRIETEDVLFGFVLGLFCFASALLIFSTVIHKVF